MARPQSPNLRRRLEQWLQNPHCDANTLSALLDVPMRDVAQAEDPSLQAAGQSPFAIARGVTFERGLLEDEAAVLVEAMRASGLLQGHVEVIDFRPKGQGGPMASPDEAVLSLEGRWKSLLVVRDRSLLLLGPPLRLPAAFAPLQGLFIPDVVLLTPVAGGRVEIRVGEIKSYHDRGGHTEAQKLAQARAQAGLYVCVLRQTVQALEGGDAVTVSGEGFLVLMRPGSGKPSLRSSEDLRWQARQAELHLQRLRELASSTGDALAVERNPKRALPLVQGAPVRYREACLGFCDRAPICHRRACSEGDPVVLGDEVARSLGAIRLERARQLLAGEPAATEAEREFVQRMSDAASCIRRVS